MDDHRRVGIAAAAVGLRFGLVWLRRRARDGPDDVDIDPDDITSLSADDSLAEERESGAALLGLDGAFVADVRHRSRGPTPTGWRR